MFSSGGWLDAVGVGGGGLAETKINLTLGKYSFISRQLKGKKEQPHNVNSILEVDEERKWQ